MPRTARLASLCLLLLGGWSVSTAFAQSDSRPRRSNTEGAQLRIRRVLLISIDGMHALDYQNCTNGLKGINHGAPYCPNLAALGKTAINYPGASASKPSDSFPGLMALVSGGSPRTVGAFYDVAYDRSLNPPRKKTGNGVAGGPCTPGHPIGTRTEYEEGIDIDQSQLNGGALRGDGGINSIDPDRLERDINCNPVYPWNFVRTNTVFGVIHAAGGYTAWSDKHPAYSSVSGPGDGTNVDDYYSPEINSTVVPLPVTTATGMECAPIPDPSQLGAYTDSFLNIQCYDTLKVNAIVNEINGRSHDGARATKIPVLFGMNFQAVSVGQKLIEKSFGHGGYLDAIGTPSNFLLQEIEFVDGAIGEMLESLTDQGLLDETLIVIAAKHGQSPIDINRFFPIPGPNGNNGTPPSNLIATYLPWSENPNNPTGIGPTEDDISLLWLRNSNQTAQAVQILEQNAAAAGIGQIFWGPAIAPMFNPPSVDPRSPDIIITPDVGVVYTGSGKKDAEHGGFSNDDTNAVLFLSNPKLVPRIVFTPVENMQVAPTILKALGLNPDALQSVKLEGTQVLPDSF